MTRTARRKAKKKYEEASTWSKLSVKQVTRVSSSGKMFQRKKKKLKTSEVEKVDEKKERMRQKRRQRRAYSKVCFKCRQPGHHLEDCKNNNDELNICFKCGSTEHSVKSCKAVVPSGSYPFAQCFICGESGHLSRSCPDNPRGLYPNVIEGCRSQVQCQALLSQSHFVP
ncbi:PREDICTED: zinc finger CCHC domain-containing protein 9-like isoform X2 [Amphimedon queenslandica]|uniref:CCHC-type domain-containing protein n=1 Tax=Amphimedon queenslandica TaxID=400682 RepID=A0AAN0J9J4_AMPQE|nr:PREDICTED: zinc finger CCHC domain-containing protein 9-like isoform X2 [Amphimedon queenslandica]|eukprot:XP_019853710.1 PREDICTED: zinc finger CCHC domain-containing protein 9-like isoform X2 [Amphimedon queenslandica]